jgi:plastocyanin
MPRPGDSILIFTHTKRKEMATQPTEATQSTKAANPIQITGSDESTGLLTLSDRGRTEADPGETIIWQITDESNVHSIVAIEQKRGTNFWSTPPQPRGANWQGTISSEAKEREEYEYLIRWKASANGPEFTHDPIISIKPSI